MQPIDSGKNRAAQKSAPLLSLHLRPEGPALGDRSDDALMLLCRADHEAAFEVLVRRHQRFALAVAYRHLGTASQAEDVVQTAFIEIHRHRARYRPEGRFPAYLYRIVQNQCRMAYRKHKSDDDKTKRLEQTVPGAAVGVAFGGTRSGEDALLEAEQNREVNRAMQCLPKKHRDVVVLRFAADLSLVEISEILEIPVGTVKSRLFSGLARLRNLLSPTLLTMLAHSTRS
jgi:RNA polymerase sigma-70 factor, ECF subfamily